MLDWLEASELFAGDKAAIMAASFGATFVSSHILASESRIRTAVLLSGYVANIDTDIFPGPRQSEFLLAVRRIAHTGSQRTLRYLDAPE